MLRGLLEWLVGGPLTDSRSPLVLHKAEEFGQSRELTAKEVMSCMVMSAMKGITAGAGLGLIYIVACLFIEQLEWNFWANVGVFLVVTIATICAQAWLDLDELRDGLRSYRSAETYTTPMPGTTPQLSAPDILVKPYGGDPYRIGRGGGPGESAPALPAPQRTITEPVIAAALQASIENDGIWSRRTITAVVVNGRKISRGMWKKMTVLLQDILIPQPDNSYRLPPDAHTFEELCERYLPTLRTGQAKTVPPACPPTRPPAQPSLCPPAQAPKEANPGQKTVVVRSRRELFQELGCDARKVVEARKKKEG